MELIPGTVCCLLCRGLVIYKHGDKSRFQAHLANEHGAFFDIDYLLASCLMEAAQKAQVAKTVTFGTEVGKTVEKEVSPTLEKVSYQEAVSDKSHQFVCGSCATHFAAKTAYLQHITKGCKKDTIKEGYSCDRELCDKSYGTKGNLNVHVKKQHGEENIKQEKVDQVETPVEKSEYSDDAQFAMDMGFATNENVNSFTHVEQQSQDQQLVLNQNHQPPSSTNNFEQNMSNGYSSYETQQNQEQTVFNQNLHTSTDSFQQGIEPASNMAELEKSNKFSCNFPPCTKSYSAKSSLCMHERKTHDRPAMKKGRRSKIDMLNDSANQNVAPFNESYPQEQGYQQAHGYPQEQSYPQEHGNSQEQYTSSGYQEFYPSEELGDPSLASGNSSYQSFGEVPVAETTLDEADSAPIDNSLNSSFLTDTSLDFDAPVPEEDNLSQCDSQADSMVDLGDFDDKQEEEPSEVPTVNSRPLVDVSKSKYFTKNPNVHANARGKSVKLFDEEAKDLPKGWMMRTIEVKMKTGGMSKIKHYLTPDTKVLKTGLAVVEYLRLEGVLSTDRILEISNKLNVSEKKLRNLYA